MSFEYNIGDKVTINDLCDQAYPNWKLSDKTGIIKKVNSKMIKSSFLDKDSKSLWSHKFGTSKEYKLFECWIKFSHSNSLYILSNLHLDKINE